MPPKKQKATRLHEFEIVFSCDKDETNPLPRLEALRRAAVKARIKPVFAVALPQLQNVRLPSYARALQLAWENNPFAAVLTALPQARSKFLIFWPKSATPDSSVLAALAKATKRFDWVTDKRGEIPAAAQLVFSNLLGFPGGDFGSPCAMRLNTLRQVQHRFGPGDALLAARMARAAASSGAVLGQLPEDPSKLLSLPQTLGSDGPHFSRVLNWRGQGLLAACALLSAGALFPKPAIVSLCSFALGFLGLGYFFGKSE